VDVIVDVVIDGAVDVSANVVVDLGAIVDVSDKGGAHVDDAVNGSIVLVLGCAQPLRWSAGRPDQGRARPALRL